MHARNLLIRAMLASSTTLAAQSELATFNGEASGDRFGFAVAWTGQRLVIGAPEASVFFAPPMTGSITVREWSGTGWTNPFPSAIPGTSTGDRFGAALSGAPGGILIVGSPSHSSLNGAGSGLAQIIDINTATSQLDVTGAAASDAAGQLVTYAGDVDGNGTDDYVVRSPNANPRNCRCDGGTLFGGRIGVYEITGILDNINGATRCRSGCSSLCNFCSGFVTHDRLGIACAGGGDIDGMPGDELLISAVRGARSGSPSDRVHIYSWNTGGPTLVRSETMSNVVRAIASLGDVNNDNVPDYAVGMDGDRVDVMDGAVAGARLCTVYGPGGGFGTVLENIGDQDGDGVDDLMIAAPDAMSGRGQVFIVAGASGAYLSTIKGQDPSGRFGASIVKLDDITGDGRLEFAIGAPNANSDTGQVMVMTLDDSVRGISGLGCAPAGTGGVIPIIGTPSGPPIAGNSYEINLTRAPVGRSSFLLIGLSRFTPGIPIGLGLSQLDGCVLYPMSDVSLQPGQTDPLDSRNTCPSQGWQEVSLTIPAATPVGTTFYAQWYVVTPGPFLVPAVMSNLLTSVTR